MVAFECGSTEGMTLNEGLVLELVTPGTGIPALPGTSGEIVVTRVNPDYPLLRFGTGIMSAPLPDTSTCGRTNMRLRTPFAPCPMAHAPMPVSHAMSSNSRGSFRCSGGCAFPMHRRRERDELHLTVEHGGHAGTLGERVRDTLHRLTALPGTVEFVTPGSLPDDEALIVDERAVN